MSATETAVPVCSEKNICLNVLENSPEIIYNKVIFRQKICQLTFKDVNFTGISLNVSTLLFSETTALK